MDTTVIDAQSQALKGKDFWCFISYCHDDNKAEGRKWANWLHKEIEHYEVPSSLVGKMGARGVEIPAQINLVFRDELSLPAGAHLEERIRDALGRSKYLLVLCSPKVVKSSYVEEEIRYFLSITNPEQIIPVIIDSEHQDKVRECLPAPLVQKGIHTLAADFRLDDGSEGFTSAEAYRRRLTQKAGLTKSQIESLVGDYAEKLELHKLKIIAGILGLKDTEELTNRDEHYQLLLAAKRYREGLRHSWQGATAATLVVIISLIAALNADSRGLASAWLAPIVLIGLYVVWALHFVPLVPEGGKVWESMDAKSLWRSLAGFTWMTPDGRKKRFDSHPLKGLSASPLYLALPLSAWCLGYSESNATKALWLMLGVGVTSFAPVLANQRATFERLPMYPIAYAMLTSIIVLLNRLLETGASRDLHILSSHVGAGARLTLVNMVLFGGLAGIFWVCYNVRHARQLFILSLALFTVWIVLLLFVAVPFGQTIGGQ